MDLSSLKPAVGSTRNNKRLGRGHGSGGGGTAGRGHKGQKSRSGYSRKVGFEGGQMPLQRRVPKFGFKNINRKEYKGINISTLQILADKLNVETLNVDSFIAGGLVSKNENVKILGDGVLTAKLAVKAHAFSKKAEEAIVAVGGTIEKL